MAVTGKTVAFYTLGCKVNQYDTEAMKEAFLARGYSIVDFDSVADVYVINTCTVTARGDAKSRQAIRRALRTNPHAVIAVTGCYSQVDPEGVSMIPGVDVIAGTNQGDKIVDLVEHAHGEKVISLERSTGWPSIAHFEGRTRAVLKIQEGCEQYCSYCIVPRARGKLRSRDIASVIEQISRFIEAGFKEIVLTGVHLGAYGKETNEFSLADLLRRIGKIPGLPRLRLSSIEPVDLTDDLFDALTGLDAFCEHLHIPLQSGSDEILKAMNRPYTVHKFAELVDKARSVFPDMAVSTDVIVGFPGETDRHFAQTRDFVEKTEFSRLHVFKFSARKGTRAALMKERVHPSEMARRSEEMIRLGKHLSMKFHERFLGRHMEVLVEESSVAPKMEGLTRNYIRVRFNGDASQINTLVTVRLDSAGPDLCEGTAVQP